MMFSLILIIKSKKIKGFGLGTVIISLIFAVSILQNCTDVEAFAGDDYKNKITGSVTVDGTDYQFDIYLQYDVCNENSDDSFEGDADVIIPGQVDDEHKENINNDTDIPDAATETPDIATETPDVTTDTPDMQNVNYKYDRYDFYDFDNFDSRPVETIIKSKKELTDYYKDSTYIKEESEKIVDKYDDDFFDKNVLYIRKYYSTGGPSLDIKSVTGNGDSIMIDIYDNKDDLTCCCVEVYSTLVFQFSKEELNNRYVQCNYIDTYSYCDFLDVNVVDAKGNSDCNTGTYITSMDQLKEFIKNNEIDDISSKYDDDYFDNKIIAAVKINSDNGLLGDVIKYTCFDDYLQVDVKKQIKDNVKDSKIYFIGIYKDQKPSLDKVTVEMTN